MHFKKYKAVTDKQLFIIEEDLPDVGAYLYIFENGKCIQDHLQDNVTMCMEFANEEFGVDIGTWEIMNEDIKW